MKGKTLDSRRSALMETILTTIVAMLVLVTVWGLLSKNASILIPAAGAAGLAVVEFAMLRFTVNPDHLRARQSDRTLKLASETLQYMKEGLTFESAQAVCALLLPATSAVAVAITDREKILGFAGAEEDHHLVGGPLKTRSTVEVLEDAELRILQTKEEIGCDHEDCSLHSAVVVPLVVRDTAVGTVKLYFRSSHKIDETQMAMAEGLSELLSTQLLQAELEEQEKIATKMELKALQSQINPHFLFNTMNTILALIRTDPDRARILLREFATFYRRMLENSEDLIPLEQELEQTLRYLGFELARFGTDRIKIEHHIENGLNTILVPAFIIQPLVENSVNHALRDNGVLNIKINAMSRGNDVLVFVSDDGTGMTEGEVSKLLDGPMPTENDIGIALKNVHDRLIGFFGASSGITIESEKGVGTTVCLTLCNAKELV